MGPKRQCQIRPVPNGRATCGHLCSRLKSRVCMLKEYRRPNFGSKAEPTVPSAGCACAINHRHGKHPCGPNVHQPPASYTGIAHSPASDSKATRPVSVQRTGVDKDTRTSRSRTTSSCRFPCARSQPVWSASALLLPAHNWLVHIRASGRCRNQLRC